MRLTVVLPKGLLQRKGIADCLLPHHPDPPPPTVQVVFRGVSFHLFEQLHDEKFVVVLGEVRLVEGGAVEDFVVFVDFDGMGKGALVIDWDDFDSPGDHQVAFIEGDGEVFPFCLYLFGGRLLPLSDLGVLALSFEGLV